MSSTKEQRAQWKWLAEEAQFFVREAVLTLLTDVERLEADLTERDERIAKLEAEVFSLKEQALGVYRALRGAK